MTNEDILKLPKTEIAEVKIYAAQGYVNGQFVQAIITPMEWKINTFKPSTKAKIQAAVSKWSKEINDILDADNL